MMSMHCFANGRHSRSMADIIKGKIYWQPYSVRDANRFIRYANPMRIPRNHKSADKEDIISCPHVAVRAGIP